MIMNECAVYTHGMFISYKRSHKHLAGRIFDYFRAKGVNPFMDEHSIGRTSDYEEKILRIIKSAPYFLCLLTADGLKDLCAPERKRKMFYKEVKCALDARCDIMTVLYGDVDAAQLSELLPRELAKFSKVTTFRIPQDSNAQFFHVMDDLMKEISPKKLHGTINWREYTARNSNVRMLKRSVLESTTASFDMRFGKAFMDCIENGTDYTGENHVREINLACYAGSIIFTPERHSVDRRAYDIGKMFKIFRALLTDSEFTLRLVINAPDSPAVQDAVRYSRLGNNAYEERPEAVFLSAYSGIRGLLAEEPFRTAEKEKRLSLTLTDCVMPFSIFHVVYKKGWETFNHVKIDLYSLDLDSSADRRSMLIFEKDDPENYQFFVHQFEFLRKQDLKSTRDRIRQNNDKWLQEWEDMKEIL